MSSLSDHESMKPDAVPGRCNYGLAKQKIKWLFMLIDLDFFGHFYTSLPISSVRMYFVKGTEVSFLSGLDISHFSDSH